MGCLRAIPAARPAAVSNIGAPRGDQWTSSRRRCAVARAQPRTTPIRPFRTFAAVAALAAAVLSAEPGTVRAQTPTPGAAVRAAVQPPAEALAAANELFGIVSKDMMDRMMQPMRAQIWALIDRELAGKSDIDAPAREALRVEFEKIQRRFLEDAMKDAPALYARHFTAVELKDLIAFYRSPTGVKALRVLPDVMAEFMQQLAPRLGSVQVQTQKAFEAVLRDKGLKH